MSASTARATGCSSTSPSASTSCSSSYWRARAGTRRSRSARRPAGPAARARGSTPRPGRGGRGHARAGCAARATRAGGAGPPARPAPLAQAARRERHGRTARADEPAELLLRERERQHDPLRRHPAAAVGEMPEEAVQAVLDARQVAEGERDRGAPRALVRAVDERRAERWVGGDPLGEAVVEDEQPRRLEDLPLRLEAEQALLGAVVGTEQVALGEQLGAERLGALEIAHEQPAQDEQAEAAADALGGDRRVPAPARQRDRSGDGGGAGLGRVRADAAREVSVGVQEADGLDRSCRAVEPPVAPLRLRPVVDERHCGLLLPLLPVRLTLVTNPRPELTLGPRRCPVLAFATMSAWRSRSRTSPIPAARGRTRRVPPSRCSTGATATSSSGAFRRSG